MDGRILINHNGITTRREEIAELGGWNPGRPEIDASGPIHNVERVSLVVPTFFNVELKRRSLKYLLAGIEKSRCVREIILVASDGENLCFDDLQAQVNDCPIRVVSSDPHNRGKSRNAGAAAATSPWLLFLDDDMLLRSWRGIDVLVSGMVENAHEGALFPRRHYARFPLLFDPPMLENAVAEWRREGATGSNLFLYDPLQQGAHDLPMLFCFPGCFMLMRREAFQRIGGFAERFVGWGFEDTEFGQRAIRELRILNLFRIGEPLLHIDHPVSPYKSDEHNTNYQTFFADADSVDINHFCRAVFRGEDFGPQQILPAKPNYAEPFEQIGHRGVPLDVEAIKPWCSRIARQQLRKHLSPLPKYILLHGSRTEGANDWDGDYDVLSLYCGTIQEFYVSPGELRVEVECADLYRFENIASHPALHSHQGLMEMAKIAKAKLLWGNHEEWTAWSSTLIRGAALNGRCFWLVLALGLRCHSAKYGVMVDRYFASLQKLRSDAPNAWDIPTDTDLTQKGVLIEAARVALETFCPAWRERMAEGASVFELQIPEVWTALHLLAQSPITSRRSRSRRSIRMNEAIRMTV